MVPVTTKQFSYGWSLWLVNELTVCELEYGHLIIMDLSIKSGDFNQQKKHVPVTTNQFS